MVYTQTNGYIPQMQSFVARPGMDQGDFATLSLQDRWHDVMGIFFRRMGPPLGTFTLAIDNVRLD